MSMTRGAGARFAAPIAFAVALGLAGCGGAASPSAVPSAPPSPSASQPSASQPAASAEPSAPASAALACASSSNAPAVTVTIKGFAYSPSTVTIKAGQAVTFQDEDGVPHTVTMLDGACDSGTISGGGGSATLVFSAPGTYRYHCRIHPTMPTATIVVEG